ncbi:MAG: hypothetical protein PHP97_04535 [Candidatus Shapirobacteria bacterium]|nr:hypothetical protein [Candidatus Shapirobacteria bacterium]MDD3002678.1 hypothetical protein [Candidatus Shapirobacteria bacterium]MDD4382882.1 hypothetical protein [Candidatus Shapirobacteria bacterium]
MNLISKIFSPTPICAADWSSTCVKDTDVATIQGFNCLFANIAQVIIYFAGIVFFIMFIRGGFSYLTSGGDPKKTAKANSTLTLAVIGLVGVIISFLIITFIGDFTGVNVTEFNIPN